MIKFEKYLESASYAEEFKDNIIQILYREKIIPGINRNADYRSYQDMDYFFQIHLIKQEQSSSNAGIYFDISLDSINEMCWNVKVWTKVFSLISGNSSQIFYNREEDDGEYSKDIAVKIGEWCANKFKELILKYPKMIRGIKYISKEIQEEIVKNNFRNIMYILNPDPELLNKYKQIKPLSKAGIF